MTEDSGATASQSPVVETLFDSEASYEYGIFYEKAPDMPHRSGMTEAEARKWISEWIEMDAKADAVSLIRRPVGKWERA